MQELSYGQLVQMYHEESMSASRRIFVVFDIVVVVVPLSLSILLLSLSLSLPLSLSLCPCPCV